MLKKESWLGTISGNKFFPFNPTPESVNLNDITVSLSYLARYNGHTKIFYSVGQHSINCAKILKSMGCSNRLVLIGLLHDSAEAYIGDIPSPIKKYIDGIEEIEDNIFRCVLLHLGIDYPTVEEWDIVMEVDRSMLYFEGPQLTENTDDWSSVFSKDVNLSIDYSYLDFSDRNFKEIQKEFLEMYFELSNKQL